MDHRFLLVSYLLAYIASKKKQSKVCFLEAKKQFSEKPTVSPFNCYECLSVLCILWLHLCHLFCLPPYYFLFVSLGVFFFFRIALQENTNRMSANALAIVFAPCILRCPDTIDPLQSVQDISKTTT